MVNLFDGDLVVFILFLIVWYKVVVFFSVIFLVVFVMDLIMLFVFLSRVYVERSVAVVVRIGDVDDVVVMIIGVIGGNLEYVV